MSKGIRSYPEGQRDMVVARRVRERRGGIGYLAAASHWEKVQLKAAAAADKLKKAREAKSENSTI